MVFSDGLMPAACHEEAVGRVRVLLHEPPDRSERLGLSKHGYARIPVKWTPAEYAEGSALWEHGSTREDVPDIVAFRAAQPAEVWLALARRSDAWAGDRSAGVDDAEGRVGECYRLTGEG